MKLIFTRLTKAKVMVFAAVLLLGGQTSANAGQQSHTLTPAQSQQFSRTLFRPSSYYFFRQGQERLEREIQILQRGRRSSTKPLLKIDSVPQAREQGELGAPSGDKGAQEAPGAGGK